MYMHITEQLKQLLYKTIHKFVMCYVNNKKINEMLKLRALFKLNQSYNNLISKKLITLNKIHLELTKLDQN